MSEKNAKLMSSVGSSRFTALSALNMLFLGIITFTIFIFPFYWVISGSFKTMKAINASPPQWWPAEPTLRNYEKLFKNPALDWFLNSVIIAVATMLIVVLAASLAGYVLAKKKFIGRRVVFTVFIAAMALPKQVILVPLVRLISGWGFHDTLMAVILSGVGWPFGVFLMKQFSEGIPGELLEAAKIDGSGEVRTFVTMVLPLVSAGMAALAIFTFVTAWNDYFMQLVMLSSRSNLTLQLGVATLQKENATDYGLLMAGAAIAAIPIITVFIAFQKYFTQGITMGAVKG